MPVKKTTTVDTKPTEKEAVDAFMQNTEHPLPELIQHLRTVILSVDKSIGEEVAWNAPSFFYTGKMLPFKPKEFKRHIVVFNLFKKDCVRLVFLRGADVEQPEGFLEGNYKDGRRLATVTDMKDAKHKEKALKKVVKDILELIKSEQT